MRGATASAGAGMAAPAPRPERQLLHGRQLVFVCGLHRSGTSWLARALSNHPQVSSFSGTGVPEDEGQHLQTVYPSALAYGGPGRFGFDRRSFMDDTHPLCTPGNADRLLAQWARYWDARCPVWLEKSPPNLVRTRFLQGLFPQAQFVVLCRHPVTTALATQGKFRPAEQDRLERLLTHWAVCHRRYLADRPYLRRVHQVQYEALLAAPGREFARVFEFLALPPLAELPQSLDAARDASYWRRWPTAPVSRWRLAWFAWRYGHIAERLGYRLSG